MDLRQLMPDAKFVELDSKLIVTWRVANAELIVSQQGTSIKAIGKFANPVQSFTFIRNVKNKGQIKQFTEALEAFRRKAVSADDLILPNSCRHWITTEKHCGKPGECAIIETPPGRPSVKRGPYCEEHGGYTRARNEANTNWLVLAPASVGDIRAVQTAGSLGLRGRHTTLVIKCVNNYWFAYRGTGRRAENIPNNDAIAHFQTKAEAIEKAVKVWKVKFDERIEYIRKARGGTLDWGHSITLMTEPNILTVADGRRFWKTAC